MKKAVFCAIASLAALVSSAEDAYVESDGTQYLDTGYCFGPNTKIELDCQLTEVEDGKSLIGT